MPLSGDLFNPEIKSASLTSPELAGRFFTTSTTWEVTNVKLRVLRSLAKS